MELGAVRVRGWQIVEEFHALVKPRVPIAPGASATHGYSEADLADQPFFEEVWPRFKAFAGTDELVAHNGYDFDFPILRRMSGDRDFVTYDTLPSARSLRLGSAKLQHLAARFGIDPGDPHKALSDVRSPAQVYRKLEEEKVARARGVALSNVLDYLGVSLALSDPRTLGAEATLLRDITSVYALGRFSDCLEFYRAEQARAAHGGRRRRADRTPRRPDPDAQGPGRKTVRPTLPRRDGPGPPPAGNPQRTKPRSRNPGVPDRVALSNSDGIEADQDRINLLTLHSTKGLEFSRVYIVGVEDTEMPGLQSIPNAERRAPSAEPKSPAGFCTSG